MQPTILRHWQEAHSYMLLMYTFTNIHLPPASRQQWLMGLAMAGLTSVLSVTTYCVTTSLHQLRLELFTSEAQNNMLLPWSIYCAVSSSTLQYVMWKLQSIDKLHIVVLMFFCELMVLSPPCSTYVVVLHICHAKVLFTGLCYIIYNPKPCHLYIGDDVKHEIGYFYHNEIIFFKLMWYSSLH